VVRPETFCVCIVMARGDHRGGGVPGALGGRVNVLHERSRVTPRRGQKRSSPRVCRTPPRAPEQRLTSFTHHTRALGVYAHPHIYLCLRIYTPRPVHPPHRYKLTTLRVFHSQIPFQEGFAPHVYHHVMNKIRGRPGANVLPLGEL